MSSTSKGFTLVEMLVVLTLLSLLVVAMGGAFRAVAQTQSRIDDRQSRSDRMRVVYALLEQTLQKLNVVARPVNAGSTASTPLFEATVDSLQWVGIMPARHGVGGRYFFRIALESVQQHTSLTIRYKPWEPGATFPDWEQCTQQILVQDVRNLTIETEGLPYDLQSTPIAWPRGWQPNWTGMKEVPQRVRISIVDDTGPWPPLVVNMLTTLQSKAGTGGFVIGGTSR